MNRFDEQCSYCSGAGGMQCTTCSGSGRMWNLDRSLLQDMYPKASEKWQHLPEKVSCTECNGRGVALCPVCGGSGKAK